ncbi:MAG: NTP transferase domain-containing protein [Methanolinea sp.]|jgi:adenosylcobinamide-phosphate guanylyltransferase|nr:NTP transferase domain-containing protein [Methanolinea sp.]
MYALILAGGLGSRLGLGEKPLVILAGTPMIRFVIDAFEASGHEVVVIISRKTPYTHNWCRAQGIAHYTAEGSGYVEDIAEAAAVLEIDGPFFTCVADLPCLEEDIIHTLSFSYRQSGKDALSSWIPRDLAEKYGSRVAFVERVEGMDACPAGINILRGDRIESPQEEVRVLMDDPRLAYNINTREALDQVARVMCCRKER